MSKEIAVLILAAGKSTRMKSDKPKVLHPLCGRPMLEYVLDLVKGLKAKRSVAILGYKEKEVRKFLTPGIKTAVQKKLLGTADAVKTALALLKNFKGAILILYADNPLLKKDTIEKLLKRHEESGADATLLTALLEKPQGYGRILRDKYFSICGIIEEKDADEAEKKIKEINTGIICFNKDKLAKTIGLIRANNRKKEYYLTDIIGIFHRKGYIIENIGLSEANEALGVNSRKELAQANKIMQKRISEKLMLDGVSIVDPDSAFINYGTKIGQDSVIYPFTVIENDVKIGKHCRIGPFAHIRQKTVLKDGVSVGNFAEIVRSKISSGTKVKHVSYIGDTSIGKQVNIGAGTIVANYDGKNKNKSVIKDNAFIGSNTVLIAPVSVGKQAMTAAGSVVVRNSHIADKTIVAGVPAKILKKRSR